MINNICFSALSQRLSFCFKNLILQSYLCLCHQCNFLFPQKIATGQLTFYLKSFHVQKKYNKTKTEKLVFSFPSTHRSMAMATKVKTLTVMVVSWAMFTMGHMMGQKIHRPNMQLVQVKGMVVKDINRSATERLMRNLRRSRVHRRPLISTTMVTRLEAKAHRAVNEYSDTKNT